jgi:hypothetical protein
MENKKREEDMTYEELYKDEDFCERLGLYKISPGSIRNKINVSDGV